MKAMVFAAGLGTRLRPYTNDKPKAMVEVQGKTLLEIVLRRLKKNDINEVVVNVHHFADLVIDYLHANNYFGLDIHISDERNELLDTGGGLKKAATVLGDEPFLIHNVDILSNLKITELYQAHQSGDYLSTLAVRQRDTSRYLEFTKDKVLCGWKNNKTKERRVSRYVEQLEEWAYSGMAIIDPRLFQFFPEKRRFFSIVDVWLEAAKHADISCYPHDSTSWLDVGKPDALQLASEQLDKLI